MSRYLVIGIAGGTGSGKTTAAESLVKAVGAEHVVYLPQDMYYSDQDLPFEIRELTNYDQPEAFDTELLIEHVDSLLAGESIERPVYDFSQHNRSDKKVVLSPKPVILLEGILILHDSALRERIQLKVFVDAPPDERFIRRLERDVRERGRSAESVINQYRRTVKPMHDLFIEPTKQHADIILPTGGENKIALKVLNTFVKHFISKSANQQPELR
ncbi:MAG: uridine kinase [Deinococcales bacterium]